MHSTSTRCGGSSLSAYLVIFIVTCDSYVAVEQDSVFYIPDKPGSNSPILGGGRLGWCERQIRTKNLESESMRLPTAPPTALHTPLESEEV